MSCERDVSINVNVKFQYALTSLPTELGGLQSLRRMLWLSSCKSMTSVVTAGSLAGLEKLDLEDEGSCGADSQLKKLWEKGGRKAFAQG